jgi:hypothetical protein
VGKSGLVTCRDQGTTSATSVERRPRRLPERRPINSALAYAAAATTRLDTSRLFGGSLRNASTSCSTQRLHLRITRPRRPEPDARAPAQRRRDLHAGRLSKPLRAWDDHEVDNDYAGDQDERGTPSRYFLLRRAAADQACYESMPLREAALPAGPFMKLYRRLQFGNLLDLSVLDTSRAPRHHRRCGRISRSSTRLRRRTRRPGPAARSSSNREGQAPSAGAFSG